MPSSQTAQSVPFRCMFVAGSVTNRNALQNLAASRSIRFFEDLTDTQKH